MKGLGSFELLNPGIVAAVAHAPAGTSEVVVGGADVGGADVGGGGGGVTVVGGALLAVLGIHWL